MLIKKIATPLVLSAALAAGSSMYAVPAHAATPAPASTCASPSGMSQLNSCHFTKTDADFINAVARVAPYYVNSHGTLQINRSDADLKNLDGFTQAQVDRLHADVLGFKLSSVDTKKAAAIPSVSRLGRVGVCFSHSDLETGVGVALSVAAAAGPEATMAALVAISSAVGGPIGGALGTIVSLLSIPTAASIAKTTLVAVATGRGVGIKVVFDYPPIKAVYC